MEENQRLNSSEDVETGDEPRRERVSNGYADGVKAILLLVLLACTIYFGVKKALDANETNDFSVANETTAFNVSANDTFLSEGFSRTYA